jgi:hypothetical protein
MGGIWAREEYDWSFPGTVRAVVRESTVFAPGSSWELTSRLCPAAAPASHGRRRAGAAASKAGC